MAFRKFIVYIGLAVLFFTSCTFVRKYQKNKPLVYKNNINLDINNVTPDEKVVIKSRLSTQLDDSSKVKIKDVAFILHYINNPPAFDTIATQASANNMQTAMVNLGFYGARSNYTYSIDSSKKQYRVTTNYFVTAGKRTMIDTFAYLLDHPELQFRQCHLLSRRRVPGPDLGSPSPVPETPAGW